MNEVHDQIGARRRPFERFVPVRLLDPLRARQRIGDAIRGDDGVIGVVRVMDDQRRHVESAQRIDVEQNAGADAFDQRCEAIDAEAGEVRAFESPALRALARRAVFGARLHRVQQRFDAGTAHDAGGRRERGPCVRSPCLAERRRSEEQEPRRAFGRDCRRRDRGRRAERAAAEDRARDPEFVENGDEITAEFLEGVSPGGSRIARAPVPSRVVKNEIDRSARAEQRPEPRLGDEVLVDRTEEAMRENERYGRGRACAPDVERDVASANLPSPAEPIARRRVALRGDVVVFASLFDAVLRVAREFCRDSPGLRIRDDAPPFARRLGTREVSAMSGELARLGAEIASRLIDPTIALSFSRPGFRIHRATFRAADLDVDLSSHRILVTGANSGIGRATASALARLGAEVFLLCRSDTRGIATERAMRAETGNPRIHHARLDVSHLADVREFAARFAPDRIDGLIHNAGVLPQRREETPEGLERAFATHVVGPWLLTQRLLPKLRAAPRARVIHVSSGGMYTTRLSLADPNVTRRRYDGVAAHAQSKRMQVVLSEAMAERLAGSAITSNAMHPGWADTPAVRASLPRFHAVTRSMLRRPEEAADTVVWLAAATHLDGISGRFYFDRVPRATHYLPWTREAAGDRERFWTLVEKSAGESAGFSIEQRPPVPRG